MRLKAKTYGIRILIASYMQLNIFSCKLLAIKKVYPICLGFQSHLEKYIIN